MTAYVIRRVWQMIPTIFGVILLIFILFNWVVTPRAGLAMELAVDLLETLVAAPVTATTPATTTAPEGGADEREEEEEEEKREQQAEEAESEAVVPRVVRHWRGGGRHLRGDVLREADLVPDGAHDEGEDDDEDRACCVHVTSPFDARPASRRDMKEM